MPDLNDDQNRFIQALHETLHRLQFFMHDMTDDQRNAACLAAITTCKAQVGADAVDESLQFLNAAVRSKVKAIYK